MSNLFGISFFSSLNNISRDNSFYEAISCCLNTNTISIIYEGIVV